MPQIKIGKIISNKMPNTVVVEVEMLVKHPLYKKTIKRTRKFKAHYEQGSQIGQSVKIIETRPIAKDVHFKVLEVIKP